MVHMSSTPATSMPATPGPSRDDGGTSLCRRPTSRPRRHPGDTFLRTLRATLAHFFRSARLGVALAATAVVSASCGGGSDGPTAQEQVASINVTAPATRLIVGESAQASATATTSTGKVLSLRLTWASDNPSIASVSADGLITGLAPGRVGISASSGAVSGSLSVDVVAAVACVVVSPDSITLLEGSDRRLTSAVTDATGQALTDRPVTWSTENVAVATVDLTGSVHAVAPGLTRVRATSEGRVRRSANRHHAHGRLSLVCRG